MALGTVNIEFNWYWCDLYQHQFGAENFAATTESEDKLKESKNKWLACE